MSKLFDECVAMSRNIANKSKFKHYSFIVQSSKIIGWGINRYVDVYHGRNVYTVHSEIDVIRRCRALVNWARPVHMINIRHGMNKSLLPSCPCKACSKVLSALGFHSVTFSTNGGYAKEVLSHG